MRFGGCTKRWRGLRPVLRFWGIMRQEANTYQRFLGRSWPAVVCSMLRNESVLLLRQGGQIRLSGLETGLESALRKDEEDPDHIGGNPGEDVSEASGGTAYFYGSDGS